MKQRENMKMNMGNIWFIRVDLCVEVRSKKKREEKEENVDE